jgi:primosomal protein N' (replication factor Y) (superfamily II helicase)
MIVDVAVPYPLARSFHYSVSPEIAEKIHVGSLVQVSFSNRLTHAYVVGFPETSDIATAKLKSVNGLLVDEPVFDEKMLKFLMWVAEYYCSPIGEVISTAIPKQSWMPRKSGKQKSLDGGAESGLIPSSIIPPALTEEQSVAVKVITNMEDPRPVLLHGVTGSGKTEVYMRALESFLALGKGAIILVPEIALTPQLLGRFSSRFPGQVAVLHSDLTPKEKFVQWERLRRGIARIVVGPRSAVFAPVKDLGLIVVDEEHETSFKQEDSVRYHARDVAIVRARFENARIILGSATPSLESYANAQSGRFILASLKKRVHQRPLPKTEFVDLKSPGQIYSPETPWLSRTLLQRVSETLKAGQQCLLYLNRLGFAHFLFCRDCGHTWRCKNCDVALTYYRNPPSLQCHYCGSIQACPPACENCSGTALDTMGVGTEQVEKSLHELLPQARIARMDRSVVKTRGDLETVLSTIATRQVDIIIGTQMVAKGHDFPGISLVGILLADASLNLPDFRANERTFQIITQVSGRAGRAEINGEVIVQTLNPEHPVLLAAAANRDEEFYRNELQARKQFGFPPFFRMAMLRFQHANERRVESFAMELVDRLKARSKRDDGVCEILGPAEAPLSKLKNMYRWHCMLKSDSVRRLQGMIHFAQEYAAYRKSPVQMAVDVDPINAL